MKFFNAFGICLIGKQKGVHVSRVPEGWAEWASNNIIGFAKEHSRALARSQEQADSPEKSKPTGRRYILKPYGSKAKGQSQDNQESSAG